MIAPGLGAMSEYLTRRTALLPTVELAEPTSAIGKSTVHAMQAGAVFGYRGLVKEILARLIAELPGEPVIVATGGDGQRATVRDEREPGQGCLVDRQVGGG